MIPVDGQTMFEVAPKFSGENGKRQATIIAEAGAVLQATLEKYDITTPLRIAHFLGQTCHESAGFRTTEEFASGEAYEGRADLGNVKKGDGVRFKGRGLIQLTGRANYRKYGKLLGKDLEADPEMAGQPALSLVLACEYWKSRDINAPCDNDDLVEVTRRINGGDNGIDDRRIYTTRAKNAVARIQGLQLSGVQTDATLPILRRGSKGDGVVRLQAALRELNFEVAIDGDFGAGTEVAVKRFQFDNKLTADGIVGEKTWELLAPAKKKTKP